MSYCFPRPLSLFALLFSILLFVSPAIAQKDGDPVSIGTYRIIESKALGETRRLMISLPRGYDGSAISYPVLYHTYGDYLSEYYAEAYATVEELGSSARIPQMILVGIDNIDRYQDLRPIDRNGEPTRIDKYNKFLETEVFPFIEDNYRTSDFRIVVGPQAGAVFGLYALVETPKMFDAYIINNPFYSPVNNNLLLEKANTFFNESSELSKFCFLTFDSKMSSPGTISEVYHFADLAASAQDNGFNLHLNNVDSDGSFLQPLNLGQGLITLFEDYYVPMNQTFPDLAGIHAYYQNLSRIYGFEVPAAEMVMTFSADKLEQQGQTDAALEILEYQADLYPNMVNAFWRLAGIAAGRDQNEKAIEYYKKCQEINPGMGNFVERRIEEIRGK